MIARRRTHFLMLALALAATLVNVSFAEEQTKTISDPTESVAKIQATTAAVKKLLREYEASNDQLILKCIRKHLASLQALEAAALATGAKLLAAREGELHDAAAASLAEQVQLAAALEAAARACLRMQSGEIVTYADEQAEPADEIPPEVPTPGVALIIEPLPPDVEPEPREQPLSGVELP